MMSATLSIKDPSFPLYAQDFLTGICYMTNEEVGMYIKLLCKQWTDGSIPKKRVGFLIGCDWDTVGDELKSKFLIKNETLVNARLSEEREKRLAYKKKQSENGKKGGRGKKGKANLKPIKNQKKPLEDENDNEDEKEIENTNEIETEKFPHEAASKIDIQRIDIDTVIESFNEQCGTDYKKDWPTLRELVSVLLYDLGYSIEDTEVVVEFKHFQSKQKDGGGRFLFNPDNLTPNTLFNQDYFPKYLENAKRAAADPDAYFETNKLGNLQSAADRISDVI